MNKEYAERENDKTNVANVNLENLEEYIRILSTISAAFLYV